MKCVEHRKNDEKKTVEQNVAIHYATIIQNRIVLQKEENLNTVDVTVQYC